jgi:uncharacterized protein YceH (UPF0502 family)
MRVLTALEGRVLGVLVEKQATVPDTYPLSLNALVAGCNQKTARVPVMEAGEPEVLAAMEGLKSLSLALEVSGSRVVRFEHNAVRVLKVPGQAVALLAVLLLRGPQTAAELRIHSERLHRFADSSSVEAFLDELAGREPPLVLRLPRAPGEREARWAQLLTGEPPAGVLAATVAAQGAHATRSDDEIAELRAGQVRLQAEVAELRALVQRLARELGVDADAGNG